MSPSGDDSMRKIRDPELRRLVTNDGSSDKKSVLVELEAPGPTVRVETSGDDTRPLSLDEPPDDQAMELARDAAQSFLDELLGARATYLGAARAFVVEARPAEIQEICRQSFVRAVHPNRTLR